MASALTRPRIFAHRGSSGAFPEHTRAAYLSAMEEGADGLEIDVHLSADGQAVCFHDFTVDRTADASGALAGFSLQQLRELDVCSWKTATLAPRYGDVSEQLMSFEDTLNMLYELRRDTALAIELKHPSPFGRGLEDEVLRVLLSFGWDPGTSQIRWEQHSVDVSFMSFDPGSLDHLGKKVPTSKLCALYADVPEDAASEQGRGDDPAVTNGVAAPKPPSAEVMREVMRQQEILVQKLQVGLAGPGVEYVERHQQRIRDLVAQGMTFRIWTVNTVEEADLLHSLGVQEMTTNYPAKLLRHFRSTLRPPTGSAV